VRRERDERLAAERRGAPREVLVQAQPDAMAAPRASRGRRVALGGRQVQVAQPQLGLRGGQAEAASARALGSPQGDGAERGGC
jgi:hypothetical protein